MHSEESNALFARFVAPAWQSPQISRVIVVLLGIEAIFWIVSGLFDPLFHSSTGDGPFPADTAAGTFISFGSFTLILLLFHLLSCAVHGRGIESMIGPFAPAWADFKKSLLFVGLVGVVITFAPPFIEIDALVFVRQFPDWAFWIIPAIVVIAIQSGTEEIIYRGYLQQQMAVYLPYKFAWMGIPSVIFGVAHYWNGYGPSEGVFFVIWATCLGFACADLTIRTGNIGAAIGLHTANNLYASLFVGINGWPGSGFALFMYPYVDPRAFDYGVHMLLDPWTIFEMVTALMVLVAMWLAARIAIRR